MSRTYSAGIATAYGAAVRGGYTGTYEEFCAALGDLARVLTEFENFRATAQTLAEDQDATASYTNGILTLGIPTGNTGNGIRSISLLSTVGLIKTYRITYTNDNVFDFPVADGKGIKSTVLNSDYTLTITYTDDTTWTSTSIRGEVGATPQFSIGTVETLLPTQPASATITGTPERPVLNLAIPRGQPGQDGASDAGAVTYNQETDYNDGTVGKELNNLNRQLNHFDDNLPGTVQTVNFGADGKPSSVVHTKNGATVRTDAYTWGDGTVTETRTTADGSYITMVTNLTTLVTTISEIQEAS